jgi:S-adenosylmethionine:diacylglycerol 3-amino-3-carboxypropyl transferase
MSGFGATPWTAGRLRGRGRARLLFGAMYEDAAIEAQVLAGCREVLAVAASGDTALQLAARDRRVTAVDVDRTQVDYVRGRLHGAPRRRGTADRLLAAARLAAPLAGWTRRRVERFLELADTAVQRRTFDRVLDTARFRALVDAGLAPAALLRAYRPAFVDVLPAAFGPVLRGRLRRGVSTHPNRTNAYARLLFVGDPPPVVPPPRRLVEVYHAEVSRFLERQDPGRFDGFTLSNVLDGPDGAFRDRLARAVRRAGAPDAPVVLRTLREPADADAAAWARRDRAMIWGAVLVGSAADFPTRVGTLS